MKTIDWRAFTKKNKYQIILGILILSNFGLLILNASRGTGYGSGDAYKVVTKSLLYEHYLGDMYLYHLPYVIAINILKIPPLLIGSLITPLLAMLTLLVLFKVVKKIADIPVALLSLSLIIFNPTVSYFSTEPSKAFFIIPTVLLSLYLLISTPYKELKPKKIFLASLPMTLGVMFYHSALIFWPVFYTAVFVIKILHPYDKKKRLSLKAMLSRPAIKRILRTGMQLVGILSLNLLLLLPFYYIRQQLPSTPRQAVEVVDLSTDQPENALIHQLSAAISAITNNPSQLGFFRLNDGIISFLNNNYLLTGLLIVALAHFIRTFLQGGWKDPYRYLPTWYFISTYIILSLQWTSYSHASRYPLYLIFFGVVIVSQYLWEITSHLKRKGKSYLYAGLFLIVLLGPLGDKTGFRDLYAPFLRMGETMAEKDIVINDNNQILFIKWPTIELSIADAYGKESSEYMHLYGWGSVDLEGISSQQYIEANHITYFLFEGTLSDYFNSGRAIKNRLQENYILEPILQVSKDRKDTILYKLTPR